MDSGFDNWERACQPLPEQYHPNALTVAHGLRETPCRSIETMGCNLAFNDAKERAARLAMLAKARGDRDMYDELDAIWWAMERYSISLGPMPAERVQRRTLDNTSVLRLSVKATFPAVLDVLNNGCEIDAAVAEVGRRLYEAAGRAGVQLMFQWTSYTPEETTTTACLRHPSREVIAAVAHAAGMSVSEYS